MNELVRFRRLVRREIREYTKRHADAPPLSLYCSHGPSPRRCTVYEVGRLEDSLDIKAAMVRLVKEHGSRFVAYGGLARTRDDGELTSTFALVVLGAFEHEVWAAEFDADAGGLEGWQCEETPGLRDDHAFVQQAIRAADG